MSTTKKKEHKWFLPLALLFIIVGGLSHGGRLKEYPMIELVLKLIFYASIIFLLFRAWKGSLPKKPTFIEKLLRGLQFAFGIILFVSSGFLLSEELQLYKGFITANIVITVVSGLGLFVSIIIYNIVRPDSKENKTHNNT